MSQSSGYEKLVVSIIYQQIKRTKKTSMEIGTKSLGSWGLKFVSFSINVCLLNFCNRRLFQELAFIRLGLWNGLHKGLARIGFSMACDGFA